MLTLPETIKVDFQPYGTVVLGDLEEGSYNGHPLIRGTVLNGTETSRLFQFTATRDITGRRDTVYGVTQRELDSGLIVRVAM